MHTHTPMAAESKALINVRKRCQSGVSEGDSNIWSTGTKTANAGTQRQHRSRSECVPLAEFCPAEIILTD